jgi:hypothetical protein
MFFRFHSLIEFKKKYYQAYSLVFGGKSTKTSTNNNNNLYIMIENK